MDIECPDHPGIYLQEHPTRWGIVWRCPINGCTVAWWGKKDTTPADYETRKARERAHAAIDPIWKSRRVSRYRLYRQMSRELGVQHIGLSDAQTCEKIIEWAKQFGLETP